MSDAPTAAPTTRSHRYSYPARFRLTRKADFDAVFDAGQRSTDRLFTVLYRRSSLDHARLGMTTAARHLRSAVIRNRVRRLIRESFRHSRHTLGNLDIVVLAKAPTATATAGELLTSLGAHWNRLGRAAART